MATAIPYDATRQSLFRPYLRPTLFDPGMDWSLQQIAVECARLAYTPFEDGQEWRTRLERELERGGLTLVQTFHDPVTDTQAMLARHEPTCTCYLAYRGTEPDSPQDAQTDVDTLPVSWRTAGGVACEVHGGFAGAFEAVEAAVSDCLRKEATSKLVLAGHSLGAALATLAASRHAHLALVTIGSPRVGNAAFAAEIPAAQVWRYVDCCDVVTEVPPELGLFSHVGARRYIDYQGRVHSDWTDEQVAADRQAGRTVYLREQAWRWGTAWVRDLADHAPINYLRAVLERV